MSTTLLRERRNRLIAIFVLILTLIFTIWINYSFVYQNLGGDDFYAHWTRTRAFILEGESPYRDEIALGIQSVVTGKPARTIDDEFRAVQPIYAEIIYAPFALIGDYSLARTAWMTVLEIVIIGLALFSMKIGHWQPSIYLYPIYLLFVLFWYHGLPALINGSDIFIVAFLIVWALHAIQKDRDGLAGLCLAFSTIRFPVVALLIFFVLVWSISNRRWTLVGWFWGWLAIFVILGMMFLPDWLMQNIAQFFQFSDQNALAVETLAFESWLPGIGAQLKWGTILILVGLLGWFWWSAWGKGYQHLFWTACFTLVVSQWVGVAPHPENFVILILPLVTVFGVVKERWSKWGDWIVLVVLLLLMFGLWMIPVQILEGGQRTQVNEIMLAPVPFVVFFGLLWVRWWILRPTMRLLHPPE